MNYGHNSATMLSVGDLPYQNLTEYTAATTFVSGAGATAVVDVIIMLGTNDSKSYNWMVGTGTRAQQFVTDCGAMVDHFASLPTHPLVYLAFPPRAFANTLRDQRNDHPRSDPAAHPAGGDGQGGADHRRRHADGFASRISSRTASTRTTPGTRWSPR